MKACYENTALLWSQVYAGIADEDGAGRWRIKMLHFAAGNVADPDSIQAHSAETEDEAEREDALMRKSALPILLASHAPG